MAIFYKFLRLTSPPPLIFSFCVPLLVVLFA